MTLLRLLNLLALSALSTLSSAQTCPGGLPRVAPDSRYTIDSTIVVVTDLATGLMWKRCSEGQGGASCTGTATTHTWTQALTLANTATHAGYSDWRLPNREELRSLVETGCHGPSINTMAFPATRELYWSSTSHAPSVSFAWTVLFVGGQLGIQFKGQDFLHIRLVRGGQGLDAFHSAEEFLLRDGFE